MRRAPYVLLALVSLLCVCVPRIALAAVRPDELAKIREACPKRATVRPARPRKILVFSLCKGFKHSSIPYWIETLKIMGQTTGAFEVVVDDDPAVFEPARLRAFDAIVMNNTTGDPLSDGPLRRSMIDFVKGGKGIVGIHAATDCFYKWTEYGEMMGGYFNAHPWNEKVAIKLDDPDHPIMKAFGGKGFSVADEIYQFKDPYSREVLRVLMSLDPNGTDMTKGSIKREDKDFAVSWVRSYGKGRVFYCSLGHRHDICWNAPILQHYLDGIQFAIGDLEADTTPGGGPSLGAGFRPIFNGKDLSGWKATRGGWRVKDGTLMRSSGGNLFTEQEYGDFVLDFEFRVARFAKSGVYLRATDTRRPSASALEIEISDSNPRYRPSKRSPGAVYGIAAPKKNAIKKAGEWNRMTITCAGSKIGVVLNGSSVVDMDLEKWTSARRNPDNSFNSYSKPLKDLPRSGKIGLQGTSGYVYFRNIRIKGGAGGGGGDVSQLREKDKFAGEYAGGVLGGRPSEVLALVFPQGERYRIVFRDGLEGRERFELSGSASGERITFSGSAFGSSWTGEVAGDKLVARAGAAKMALSLSTRSSPTLGASPPRGAVVLLAASQGAPSLNEWQNKDWQALPGGVMQVGKHDNKTVKQFGSMKLHLEFMTPYMPGAGGQGRGNSGIYIQDRYEVQVLDSFGLDSKDNDCGGIYKVATPKVNACLPPLVWQTYDVTFHAPKISGGQATRHARITVVHNGVTIHDDVEIPRPTGGAAGQNPVAKAPLRLQDHGNPVRYRNIWIVETRD